MVVRTEGTELIDEMFSRLNEAVPLNAPEKRNAFGGPLPRHIRTLAATSSSPAQQSDPRTRAIDISTWRPSSYISNLIGGLSDLKKRDLDAFVRDFKEQRRNSEASQLYALATLSNLALMSAVFLPFDPLLRSVGMITIYYALFREAGAEGWDSDLSHNVFEEFDVVRERNRALIRETQERALHKYHRYHRKESVRSCRLLKDTFRARMTRPR